MCYVAPTWNLCCLYGGTYCSGSGGSSTSTGYYGVCNNDQCEQKYLLQAPAFTCTTDAQCIPNSGGGASTTPGKFVGSADGNWLKGLDSYVVTMPKDPGAPRDAKYNQYYASSHPDIVHGHGFCVYMALEGISGNINPYNDLTDTPTGPEDQLLWSTLCVK
jgi:hypothetical protein